MDKEPYTIFLNFSESEHRKERMHFDLMLGEESVFSDATEETLLWTVQESGKKFLRMNWFPASIDRGAIEVRTRIFVKLEKDGTITIETPRRLRTFNRG